MAHAVGDVVKDVVNVEDIGLIGILVCAVNSVGVVAAHCCVGFVLLVVEGVEIALLMVTSYELENRLTLRKGIFSEGEEVGSRVVSFELRRG